MAFTFNDKEFLKGMELKQKQFLIASGHVMVNQMTETVHVITGLLKNSILFRLVDGTGSNFGTFAGENGEVKRPEETDKISESSSEDFVRVGSNVVYAGPYEKKVGSFANAVDTVIADKSILTLARKIFKS